VFVANSCLLKLVHYQSFYVMLLIRLLTPNCLWLRLESGIYL